MHPAMCLFSVHYSLIENGSIEPPSCAIFQPRIGKQCKGEVIETIIRSPRACKKLKSPGMKFSMYGRYKSS